jgi:hypothetical protein
MNIGYKGRITFDYGSNAFVNKSQEVPLDTNCSLGNLTSDAPSIVLVSNTLTIGTNDTNCAPKIQATPNYGWC